MEQSQTKTRTTMLESLKNMKNALKETMHSVFIDNGESEIINRVEDIPSLDAYTSEDDIQIIRRMEKLQKQIELKEKKIKSAKNNLGKQIDNPTLRPQIRAKVVQSEKEEKIK